MQVIFFFYRILSNIVCDQEANCNGCCKLTRQMGSWRLFNFFYIQWGRDSIPAILLPCSMLLGNYNWEEYVDGEDFVAGFVYDLD